MTVLTRLIGSQSRKAILLHEVVYVTQAFFIFWIKCFHRKINTIDINEFLIHPKSFNALRTRKYSSKEFLRIIKYLYFIFLGGLKLHAHILCYKKFSCDEKQFCHSKISQENISLSQYFNK